MPSPLLQFLISTTIEFFVLLFVGYEVVVGEIRHRRTSASVTSSSSATRPQMSMRLGLFIVLVSGAMWAVAVISYHTLSPSSPLPTTADSDKNDSLETQKATLIEWLQTRQRDLDEARKENDQLRRNEAQKAALTESLQKAQRERDEARKENDQLRTQLQTARSQQPIDSKEQECVKLARQLLTGATEMGYDFTEEYKNRVQGAMMMLNCNAPNK